MDRFSPGFAILRVAALLQMASAPLRRQVLRAFRIVLFLWRYGAVFCRDEITDAPSEYDVP
jgi:hypothetical protein